LLQPPRVECYKEASVGTWPPRLPNLYETFTQRLRTVATIVRMRIVACSGALMGRAETLVRSVFPTMSPTERLSFYAIRNPSSIIGQLLMFFAGVRDVIAFDVYVDESDRVLGTTGLYRYKRDAEEAAWVAWFCVDPQARGRGIGQALIDHTVSRARAAGFKRVRLYTSTDPNESAAQRLYEKNGFMEVRRQGGLFGTTIFREKVLGDRA